MSEPALNITPSSPPGAWAEPTDLGDLYARATVDDEYSRSVMSGTAEPPSEALGEELTDLSDIPGANLTPAEGVTPADPQDDPNSPTIPRTRLNEVIAQRETERLRAQALEQELQQLRGGQIPPGATPPAAPQATSPYATIPDFLQPAAQQPPPQAQAPPQYQQPYQPPAPVALTPQAEFEQFVVQNGGPDPSWLSDEPATLQAWKAEFRAHKAEQQVNDLRSQFTGMREAETQRQEYIQQWQMEQQLDGIVKGIAAQPGYELFQDETYHAVLADNIVAGARGGVPPLQVADRLLAAAQAHFRNGLANAAANGTPAPTHIAPPGSPAVRPVIAGGGTPTPASNGLAPHKDPALMSEEEHRRWSRDFIGGQMNAGRL